MDRVRNGRTKYGNRKVRLYGQVFDSKKEGERFLLLKAAEKRGEIRELKTQVPFELIPAQKHGKWRATKYIADFTYYKGDEFVVEDAKGYRTEVYRIKKKLMLWMHGIEIKEV